MKTAIRIGIVGVGGMGAGHARLYLERQIKHARLVAVGDTDPQRLARYPKLKTFADPGELIASGAVDALVIATPHYAHTTVGIAALRAGLHVLVEKPISVHKADAARLIAAQRRRGQVFAAMFNLRATPGYQRIRTLLRDGTVGRVQRWSWTATNWFRSFAYYAAGGWRATWAGEGGGVLLNQCPHNLDMIYWLFGMPRRLRAFCHFGKYHPIEVEDEVTAWLEYPDGMTGVFIASTGEAPGTDRLEITGDRGRLVFENKTLRFWKNKISTARFSRTTKERFAGPPGRESTIRIPKARSPYVLVHQNFVDAIRAGTPLLAPAREGIHSVELANAMVFSSRHRRTLDLPLDGAAYERLLKRWIRMSPRTPRPKQARR
ncbi:Gfo/Idh/MocA family oxidoreductase [bacterium]|nr:Gfo/Idh/MocA family oxidoreductase [bacterium]